MPAVTTTRSNLAWTLLLVRNGSAPTMEDPPACSLDAILATLFTIAASSVTAETARSFDALLQDVLETANGGSLPTIEEAPPYSLEKIFWNLCLVENGSAPTIHPPMDYANEQLLANLTLDVGFDVGDALLLDDGASFLLLGGGTDKLLLAPQ